MRNVYLNLKLAGLWLVLVAVVAHGQQLVTGTVRDETGVVVPGANIFIKGTAKGVTSDANGAFSIQAAGSETLVISFIGYKPQEILVGAQTSIAVILQGDLTTLEEVVVVGYGTQQKKDITGSISSISAKDFSGQPVNRLDQALQGRVPGVQVTNSSGAPGGDVKIRIRGSNSISGGNNPLYVVDGFIGADFQNVNPDDIESIQVLKDASATAIYGSRGANGVILITTRKGSKDGVHVSFTSRYASSSLIRRYDLLSAVEYAETVNSGNAALGLAPSFTAEEVQAFRTTGGTDWQDEIFRRGYGQEQLLSINGGNDKSQFFVSGNYLDQDGIIVNSGFRRYGFRANLNSSINEKFSMRFNFSGTRRETLNARGNIGKSGPVTQALSWAPTTPVRNAAGNYIANDPIGSIFQNPVALANEVNNGVNSTVGNLAGGFNYEIIEGLTLDIGYGLNYENLQTSDFVGTTASGNNQATAARLSDERILLLNVNNLTYTKTFDNQHSLAVTAVFEQQSYRARGFSTGATNLTFPALGADNLSNINDGGTITSSGAYINYGLRSFLGRVNYAFKEKYLVTASIRQDASSKFKEANQSSLFPSVGLGWRISEESFLSSSGVITNLKLRAGYGITGNQGIDPYGTFSNYLSDPYNAFFPFTNNSLATGIVLGNPGNPGLKWETTAQSNVGLDLELGNKISLGVDYFTKNTSDLLLYQPVPNYAGGGVIPSNVGKVQNSGIEVYLAATPLSKSNFVWETAFNFSSLNNDVVSLGDQKRIFTGSNVGSGLSTQSEFVLIPGEPMGSLWGVRYVGTWKPSEAATATLFGASPGDSRYEDVNGDNQITSDDFQIIGNGLPKLSLGFNNTFTLKGLTLNVFVQGLFKYDKLNYLYGVSASPTADVRQATHSDIQGRYVPGQNETSDIPAFSSTDKTYIQSSRFVQKGDFLRVKNVSLSYDLPGALLKDLKAKVFVGANNLYTFTRYKGFDPESSSVASNNDVDQGIDYGSYPNAKSYVLGVTLKF